MVGRFVLACAPRRSTVLAVVWVGSWRIRASVGSTALRVSLDGGKVCASSCAVAGSLACGALEQPCKRGPPGVPPSFGSATWWESLCRLARCGRQPRQRWPTSCRSTEVHHSRGAVLLSGPGWWEGLCCVTAGSGSRQQPRQRWTGPVERTGPRSLATPFRAAAWWESLCRLARGGGRRTDGDLGHAAGQGTSLGTAAFLRESRWWEGLC